MENLECYNIDEVCLNNSSAKCFISYCKEGKVYTKQANVLINLKTENTMKDVTNLGDDKNRAT